MTVPNRDYRYIMSFNYKLRNVKNVSEFSFKNSKNKNN